MTSTIGSDTLTGLAAEFAALVDRMQRVELTLPAMTRCWGSGERSRCRPAAWWRWIMS